MHDGSISYTEATVVDCAAIKAMTDAMTGTNKPFVMSSGTGLMGESPPCDFKLQGNLLMVTLLVLWGCPHFRGMYL